MPDVAVPTPPAPPPRKKRRLLKLLIAVLVAVAIVIAVVQAVLWSDYPRQIAIRVAQNVTGLRIDIGKLTLTWRGDTTIENLRVALPLADRPFLVVPRIEARHTSLPGVLVTLGVAIDAVTVDRPELDVRQGSDGVWNLQHVLNQLAMPGKNASAGGVTHLPNVEFKDATVRVTRTDGHSIEVRDVVFTAARDGALVWKFDGHAANLATASGEVSAAGRWPHRVSVVVKPAVLKAIEPLTGVIPTVASATLQWQGERTPTGVAGRLTIPEKTTQAGPVTASGVAVITLDGGNVSVVPDGLTVTLPGQPPITFAGGTVGYADYRVTLGGVRTRFADGSMTLDGSADVTAQRGHLTAAWQQIAFPGGVVHQGHATLEAANIWNGHAGRPWVKGDLSLLGTVAGDTFEAKAALTGDGPAWTDATFVVDLPVLRYSRESELRVEDVRAVVHATADAVELTQVNVRQSTSGTATLDARGVYHFAGPAARTGYFTAVGRGFRFAGEPNLAFNANAWADAQSITLQNAYARLGTDAWANLAGQYVYSRPEPVGMQLDFGTDPGLSLAVSSKLTVAGHATGSMKVGGTLSPTHVTLDGNMASRGLKVNDFLIGDADLLLRGTLRERGVEVRTEQLRAFGGDGWFGADFPYFSKSLHAWMGFDDIDLAQIGRAVGSERVTGMAAGSFDLNVPVDDLRHVYGNGRIDVVRPAAAPWVAAESLHIPVSVGDGYVRVAPEAVQAAGGTAGVSVLVSLDTLTKFKLGVGLKDWLTPLPMPEFSLLTSGKIDLPQVDVAATSVSGSVDLGQRYFAHEKPIGDVAVRLHADGRQIRLESVGGSLLGGNVYGVGTLNFDDLSAGEFKAGIKGLSLDRLAALDPRLVGVQGQLSAFVHTHAATGDAPLGPVQVDLDVLSDRATYKSVDIGDSHVRLFADRDRLALNDDPNDPNYVRLAGGTAKLWGRLSRVPATDADVSRTSAFASVHLDGIDTEQLDQMIDPDGRPTPGRLGGDVVIFGNPADAHGLSGQGKLLLTDSDLANVGPLAVLYDAMHLSIGIAKPSGHGSVSFRLNAGKLDVTGLDYFNRGIYARGALTLGNVLDLKNSTIDGYVLGTYRPLKDVKLPFFGTVDSILDALQSSATTLKIEGYVEKDKIKATPVSLKQISGGLKSLLVGEAQAK